uniref:Uncharacterized protein n=1 Tax=Steinernema glaseri TaxID=37863 RepID=A0A1I7ZI43_9BILA
MSDDGYCGDNETRSPLRWKRHSIAEAGQALLGMKWRPMPENDTVRVLGSNCFSAFGSDYYFNFPKLGAKMHQSTKKARKLKRLTYKAHSVDESAADER